MGCGAAHGEALDLPARTGDFWLRLDTLPAGPAPAPAPPADALHFDSLAALTDHALRSRADSRAAWLGIQAEAARLDAATAANWPTLTGQFSFTRSQALSSSGASVPVLHRYGPSLSLAYVLYDFGARAAASTRMSGGRCALIARTSLRGVILAVPAGTSKCATSPSA